MKLTASLCLAGAITTNAFAAFEPPIETFDYNGAPGLKQVSNES